MTRKFNENIDCPHCGKSHTVETAFERWFRNEPQLESSSGLVRFDLDLLLHRYRTDEDKRGNLERQYLMFVEVKTRDGKMAPSQRDTLGTLDQVLRNRKTNVNNKRKGRHAIDHSPLAKVTSLMRKRQVELRMFGGHVLVLSGKDPVDSSWMKWGGSHLPFIAIDKATLVKVLRFENDPDSPLKKLDVRRRWDGATYIPADLECIAEWMRRQKLAPGGTA